MSELDREPASQGEGSRVLGLGGGGNLEEQAGGGHLQVDTIGLSFLFIVMSFLWWCFLTFEFVHFPIGMDST